MDRKSIWVVCLDLRYEIEPILQLINKAHDLGSSQEMNCVAVCIGECDEKTIEQLGQNGADLVIHAYYQGNEKREAVEILKQMIEKYEPEIIMFQGNNQGKYLAAVCATAFEVGLIADCVDIQISSDGDFIFSRAALNESIIADIKVVNSNIKMCTVKQNSFPSKHYTFEKACEVICFTNNIVINNRKIEVLERHEVVDADENRNWQTDKLVFGVGRGVTNKVYLNYINQLAKRYNATVVGTRAAVEAGMIEKRRQVGQSGYSITPDIYIAFGISGACQHIVGIKNAKLIMAINRDEKASIFDYADYKIVDSVEVILDEWMSIL